MNVWVENYDGCTCAWICARKHDLPGSCSTHGTFALGTDKLTNHTGEVGYIAGEVESHGNPA